MLFENESDLFVQYFGGIFRINDLYILCKQHYGSSSALSAAVKSKLPVAESLSRPAGITINACVTPVGGFSRDFALSDKEPPAGREWCAELDVGQRREGWQGWWVGGQI